MPDIYTHGHHESVLRSHRWRTAENSAGYLLGDLRAGQRVLDVGCGPGTVSVDLARRVPAGSVIGVDATTDVVNQAATGAGADGAGADRAGADGAGADRAGADGAGADRAGADRAGADGAGADRAGADRAGADTAGADRAGVDRAGADRAGADRAGAATAFGAADLYRLPFADASFDIVHAHQVLQHLADPVAALSEAARVLRTGGLLAVRDSDYGGFVWGPEDPRLDRWLDLYHQVTRHNGAEPDAGRHLPSWVRAAGFTDLRVTSSTWTFADPDSRSWWGGLWADRVVSSAFAHQTLAYGLAERPELDELAAAWRHWALRPDGVFVTPHVEVLARRS